MSTDKVQGIRQRMWRILTSQEGVIEEPYSDLLECRHTLPEDRKASPGNCEGPRVPWVLEEWRRISIPQWRRILREAQMSGDSKRAKYAEWMLEEILKADDEC